MHGLSFFSEVVESKFIHFVSMRQNDQCLIPPTRGYTDERKGKKKRFTQKNIQVLIKGPPTHSSSP